jgi:hypothetical protein
MPLKTADNNFGTAKWIVSSAYSDGCTHTTIASALTSAASGDTIFIRPGTYTENLTLVAGVNICAYECDALTPNVTIVGKCSFSSAGTVSMSGLRLKTNSDYFLAVTGSAASIVNLSSCYCECSNASGISFTTANTSSSINLINCSGDITTTGITFFVSSATGTLNIKKTSISNSGASTTASTASAGTVSIDQSRISFAITTSSTAYFTSSDSGFTVGTAAGTLPLTIGGTPGAFPNTINNCGFVGGSAPGFRIDALSEVRSASIYSTNTNAITGGGFLGLGYVLMNGGATNIVPSTGTDMSLCTTTIILEDRVQITSGSGSPNGVVTAPKGSLYLRTDGSSTSTRLYTNTNSGTSWTAITTAT